MNGLFNHIQTINTLRPVKIQRSYRKLVKISEAYSILNRTYSPAARSNKHEECIQFHSVVPFFFVTTEWLY